MKMKNTDETKLALRPAEAAIALGVSVRTLSNLLSSGKISYVKLERAVLIPIHELNKFIKDNTSKGDTK
jgi:excisionase family DNA binding protein